ncbi:glycosyl transferase family 2 [Saccharothrix saharensis]|uniref:Glycosyl transferase family 2 n=1 Tax=Saccharothrix saharensis TaxID=571190 RepID=A0A543J846_9PSEU|nr:glycosyltransferase family A protein [Saccharothrix saharensis]TQM79003.1 glycosyl transferase family 2 [Saccharothrix saharensis]
MSREDAAARGTPRTAKVSVLMPTYRQAHFLPRAVGSLLDQTFRDWELIVVDDGSTDDTADVIARWDDPRIKYHRLVRNEGLGYALGYALRAAVGTYVAYLPSDDHYDPHHLANAVAVLDREPDCYAAYGGLRWWTTTDASKPFRVRVTSASLRGDDVVGAEERVLLDLPEPLPSDDVRNGNVFALVQVVHRRDHEAAVRWPTRSEVVSDGLERDHWRELARRGALFRYTGEVSCEWGDHPDQRHKIIGGRGAVHPTDPTGRGYGLARYRQFYGIEPGRPLNWRAGFWGLPHDQGERYGPLRATGAGRSAVSADEPLRILVVGELGFNPERILAFVEAGHSVRGSWITRTQAWQTVGPLPFPGVEDIPFDGDWTRRVREYAPHFIYALLNWQALSTIGRVLDEVPDIPMVFHFKEGPHLAAEMGLWPVMVKVLRHSAGVIFINQECREFFERSTKGCVDGDRVLILDGDLPKANWMTDDWSPKLSALDGEPHTVCVGRIRVESRSFLEPMPVLEKAGVHVHVYGETYQKWSQDWIETGRGSRFLHLHPTVEPANWVRELSRYDAAWPHIHESSNQGDLRRAHWDDLNLPARLGTYAVAGLPWMVRDNSGHRVAVQSLAERHGLGVVFNDIDDLAERLRDTTAMAGLTDRARAARPEFSFDDQLPVLLAFCRRVVEMGPR